ncbi:MAG: tRNA lysidine(34) synthetase TilS [Bacteriovoracaceae bacterium]
MKKLSQTSYRALFFKHVWRFLNDVLNPKKLEKKQAIAISGGLDSMALLWFAKTLYQQGKIGQVRALFVHHHTRPGQDLDLDFVKRICLEYGVSLTVLHAEGLNGVSNFENMARKERRKLLLEALAPGENLWLGHHLDDSYEWSFMQRHRSNNPKRTIGIPVKNGRIIRPFLCVTRSQLQTLCRHEQIAYQEDPTNLDLKYDRNFIRHEIIPKIKLRYPQYLKHYAHWANFSAMLLNLNIANKINGTSLYVYDQGAILRGMKFSEFQVQELIHNYSNTDRGEIISQISKMLKAIENQKKGPFQFSGGIDAYYSFETLIIYKRNLVNHDESVAKVLEKIPLEELKKLPTYTSKELERSWENLLRSNLALKNMPGLVLVLENDSICKTLNTSVFDALSPKVSQVCQARGLRFIPYAKCLKLWKSKKEKLPESLRLLPLENLSHLFAFQE